jgi:hypothetical protein
MFNKFVDYFAFFLLIHAIAIFIFNFPPLWRIGRHDGEMAAIVCIHIFFWVFSGARNLMKNGWL